MHTTMVPEQVKTMKIQAGIQVSRPRELTRQLQLWKRFGRLYLIVFVLVRNIAIRLESIESSMDLTLSGPRLDADFLVADSKFMKVAFGVGFKKIAVPSSSIVTTSRYVVPTGRVKVPAGRYVVPTGKDNVIVSTGRTSYSCW
ncbi:hypothetical protein Tco_1327679 [Tanacetum coccineum]